MQKDGKDKPKTTVKTVPTNSVKNIEDRALNELFITLPKRCQRKGCRGRIVQLHSFMKHDTTYTEFLCIDHAGEAYAKYMKRKKKEEEEKKAAKEAEKNAETESSSLPEEPKEEA